MFPPGHSAESSQKQSKKRIKKKAVSKIRSLRLEDERTLSTQAQDGVAKLPLTTHFKNTCVRAAATQSTVTRRKCKTAHERRNRHDAGGIGRMHSLHN